MDGNFFIGSARDLPPVHAQYMLTTRDKQQNERNPDGAGRTIRSVPQSDHF
jgi:hypothetical protein